METHPQITCSVLIPSRGRPAQLASVINQLFSSTKRPTALEVCVFVDDDDPFTLDVCSRFGRPMVHAVVSPRIGYENLLWMYNALSHLASGRWSWFFNDDLQLYTKVGVDWLDQLYNIQCNALVYPEMSMLHESVYFRQPKGPFPITPSKAWSSGGDNRLYGPVDEYLWGLLKERWSWPVKWIDGIVVRHDRPDESVLRVHREGGKEAITSMP